MSTDKSLTRKMRLTRKGIKFSRQSSAFSMILGLVLIVAFAFGCAPPSPRDESLNSSDSSTSDLPELTDEIIRERINDAVVWDVPEKNGTAEPTSWRFNRNEPKEISVVEKKTEGTRATITLNIKTRSARYMPNPRALEGQIRTEWELKTGWALRKWEVVRTENLSMKYENLSKPPAQNSNR